jgi:hypothetical protein
MAAVAELVQAVCASVIVLPASEVQRMLDVIVAASFRRPPATGVCVWHVCVAVPVTRVCRRTCQSCMATGSMHSLLHCTPYFCAVDPALPLQSNSLIMGDDALPCELESGKLSLYFDDSKRVSWGALGSRFEQWKWTCVGAILSSAATRYVHLALRLPLSFSFSRTHSHRCGSFLAQLDARPHVCVSLVAVVSYRAAPPHIMRCRRCCVSSAAALSLDCPRPRSPTC